MPCAVAAASARVRRSRPARGPACATTRPAAHAATFLDSLPSRPIAPTATVSELQHRLSKPLPEAGLAPEAVIDELVRDADGGLMGSGSGRFFGWVIGGTLPVALAADWLTSTWDQNAA